MMNFVKTYRKQVLIIGLSLLIIIVGFYFIFERVKNKKEVKEQMLLNEEVIPTVDSNVIVNLKESTKKGEIILTIENAPSGTREIEYQLSYDAISKEEGGEVVPRGVIGKCMQQLKISNTWSCQQPTSGEAIVLGTCSSGTCVYDQITGKINVQLKFTGTYGERIYEKNYDL